MIRRCWGAIVKVVVFKQERVVYHYNDSFLPGSPVSSFPAEGWKSPWPPVPSSVATRSKWDLLTVHWFMPSRCCLVECSYTRQSRDQPFCMQFPFFLPPNPLPSWAQSTQKCNKYLMNQAGGSQMQATQYRTSHEAQTVLRCHQVLESLIASPWLSDPLCQAWNPM